MKLFAMLVVAVSTLHGSAILNGRLYWNDGNSLSSGSFIRGRESGLGGAVGRRFAFAGLRNEDDIFCSLDAFRCTLGSIYYPTVSTVRGRTRTDLFLAENQFNFDIRPFDYSSWTDEFITISTPFSYEAAINVIRGDRFDPDRKRLFEISNGGNGWVDLKIVGGPGSYSISSATFRMGATSADDPHATPEPATILLTGVGITGLAWWKRRRRQDGQA